MNEAVRYAEFKSAKRVSYIHSEELIRVADLLPSNLGRASLVHDLIQEFGLLYGQTCQVNAIDHEKPNRARIVTSQPASRKELCAFHDKDYINAMLDFVSSNALESDSSGDELDHQPTLKRLRVQADDTDDKHYVSSKRHKKNEYGLQDDCPMFKGISSYVCEVAGASLTAARCVRDGDAEVAIAWTGGRHHAKRGEAAGFCYVQDIVLAIMELRKPLSLQGPPLHSEYDFTECLLAQKHAPSEPALKPQSIKKVLYLDLDLHHGDGVEAAFYTSPHVLTLSIHLFAPLFYPASGALYSHGPSKDKSKASYKALNVALRSGLSSPTLLYVFDRCVEPIRAAFQPDAVVVQCGCDGLSGDPCREWNVDLQGLGEVVKRVMGWNLKTVLLGGGGYLNSNAARCFAYLTSIALDCPLDLETLIPPDVGEYEQLTKEGAFTLNIPASEEKKDENSQEMLAEVEKTFKGYARLLLESER